MSPARLGLMEAYHAAHRFMVHIEATPERINEPTDGVVELIGGGYLSRVRVDDKPMSQSGVIALLRTMEEHPDLEPVLFSPMGYSNGAISFANSRGMAMFELTSSGEVVPVTTHARSLMPKEPLGPAFDDFMFGHEESEETEAEDTEPHRDDGPGDWKPCAACGVTNHPNTSSCASCGADLTLRVGSLLTSSGKMFEERGRSPQGTPTPSGGASTLRCKTCGSHEIELISS